MGENRVLVAALGSACVLAMTFVAVAAATTAPGTREPLRARGQFVFSEVDVGGNVGSLLTMTYLDGEHYALQTEMMDGSPGLCTVVNGEFQWWTSSTDCIDGINDALMAPVAKANFPVFNELTGAFGWRADPGGRRVAGLRAAEDVPAAVRETVEEMADAPDVRAWSAGSGSWLVREGLEWPLVVSTALPDGRQSTWLLVESRDLAGIDLAALGLEDVPTAVNELVASVAFPPPTRVDE